MHRSQPVASQICSDKWNERTYRQHREKLHHIKPSIDNKPPKMYPHLYQKLKKAQTEEERCSEIERDNRTLVKRMTEIMQRSALDNQNNARAKSLNRDSRKRELLRITQENHALLRRIQQRQPTYNHLVWEQQREKNEQLCDRICRYPYRPRQSTERRVAHDGLGGMTSMHDPDGTATSNPHDMSPTSSMQSPMK
eukprot:PhM_4_TR10013/c1_g1_i2/m.34883